MFHKSLTFSRYT